MVYSLWCDARVDEILSRGLIASVVVVRSLA